jgi:transcriptional regulator of heat shock response
MANLTERNIEILKIIIEEYIKTGDVLGSKLLLKKYNLGVSSATVRNDMATLETLELVYQPYNSAGRLPTAKWLRAFVNYMMQQTPEYFLEEKNSWFKAETIREFSDFVHNIVYNLAKNTKEIAFFVHPDKHVCEYSGVAQFLQRNHKRLWDDTFMLLKMLEDKPNFSSFISGFPIKSWVNIFIWEENILPYLKDYTIILKPLEIDDAVWYIGIIWGLKMNYSFNISAVKGII